MPNEHSTAAPAALRDLRYDGRVAIITGAGNGLGRSHALLLASRGAKVVVNDLGGSTHGAGRSSAAADKVVAEIKAAGGDAVANYDSVEDGDKIVQCALDTYKRLDIVINNAGILRDVSFQKMTAEDWDLIYRVHVLGSFRVTHAAWNHLRDAGYGRILFTSSAAGIYGNFGQANYSTAKLGLYGLANTLAIEGKKKNILVHTIAPVAGSRMTETVLPKELLEALKPEFVSPLVAWLCHESCTDTGGLYEVGGGFIGKLRWERSAGHSFKLSRPLSPEEVQKQWPAITSFAKSTHPGDIQASMQPVLDNLPTAKGKGGNEFIDVDAALGYEFPQQQSSYDEREAALYALSVGAGKDPLDSDDLQLVYELHGGGFRVLPTYGVVPALGAIFKMAQQGVHAPGMHYGFERILHGEQYLELRRPLPAKAKLTHKIKIKDIFDKGKNALVVTSISTSDESGEELAYNEVTTVVRGAGGWGGDRGPSSEINTPPSRDPDAVVTEKTGENQALLYRLTGDWNPLHADPAFAQGFGFPRPILHGLCTFGFAARHVLRSFCKNDPRYFKSIKVRFADSVFPGETLVTEMWKESDTRIVFRSKVKERDKVVISNAAIELYKEIPAAKPKAAPAPAAAATAPAAAAPAAAPPAISSSLVFFGIDHYVRNHPELVQKVQTVFQWKLTSPDSSYVLDLKNGAGSCQPGVADKPDTTLELSESDFMDLTTGKADPQKLYFGGKLKISGNLMASQKLTFLQKIDREAAAKEFMAQTGGKLPQPPAAAPTQAAPAPAALKTGKAGSIFGRLGDRLMQTPDLAKEVGAMVQFVVKAPDAAYTVDLRSAPGSVTEGRNPGAALTLTLDDESLVALCHDPAQAQDLFMHGKVRADGDVRLAHRLGFLKGLA